MSDSGQTLLACLLTALALAPGSVLAEDLLRASPERMQERIDTLAAFGANPEGGVSRIAFSDFDLAAREWLRSEMERLGLTVRVDTAGNIIGHRDGSQSSLPPIVFGSHIDSVPGGGNYDGQVGVVGALEVIDLLNSQDIVTRHPLEVVSFTDEEGGLSGSRAMIGTLTDTAMDTMSHAGLTIRDGIARVGGDPDNIDQAARKPGEIRAFLELHIEQGAFLNEDKIDIGVVEGIVGIRWWDIVVSGKANHAGTTPMNRRQDALVAAARLTLGINSIANELEGRQVATVGRIEAFPGAPNVIPGEVQMSLEIRDLDADKMQKVFDLIEAEAEQIADSTGTTVAFTELDVAAPPAPTDVRVRDIVAAAADKLGLSNRRMPSGAGHDAQDMAKITPTGMIFVPSVGGISHSPNEFTSAADMANGASVLLHSILAIDALPDPQ
jgi:N-carbamoyl-L-amino-acid hydrolase